MLPTAPWKSTGKQGAHGIPIRQSTRICRTRTFDDNSRISPLSNRRMGWTQPLEISLEPKEV